MSLEVYGDEAQITENCVLTVKIYDAEVVYLSAQPRVHE